MKLWRKAVAQGNADALCNMGSTYFNGTGVPQDKAEGLMLLRRTAEQGIKKAKDLLSRISWDAR